MTLKPARATPYKEVDCSEHPFVLFWEHRAAQQRYMKLVGQGILTARTLYWAPVQILRVEEDVRWLLHTPPYSWIFIVTESTYEELVCEFNATFTLECETVSFRLCKIDRMMDIAEFGVAPSVWTREELTTPF